MQGAEQLQVRAATPSACSSSRRRSACSRRACATAAPRPRRSLRGQLQRAQEGWHYAKQCHHRIVNDSVDKAGRRRSCRSSATLAGKRS